MDRYRYRRCLLDYGLRNWCEIVCEEVVVGAYSHCLIDGCHIIEQILIDCAGLRKLVCGRYIGRGSIGQRRCRRSDWREGWGGGRKGRGWSSLVACGRL